MIEAPEPNGATRVAMKIRADFAQRAVVRPGEAAWTPSPQQGVDRIMLDRIGEEVARATSFVRFSPGGCFPFHEHGGGEEVFVLDGVFADEFGRYPAGTYMRDPVGSSHAPFSDEGCTIFVKLWQFAPDDKSRVVVDTASADFEPSAMLPGASPGLTKEALHSFAGVSTSIFRLAPGLRYDWALDRGGAELLVLDGAFSDFEGDYPKGSWIRDPGGGERTLVSAEGCALLVKTGHLPPDLAQSQFLAAAAASR
jgi:anti-sigma factor ChrR (cupin superfamily)